MDSSIAKANSCKHTGQVHAGASLHISSITHRPTIHKSSYLNNITFQYNTFKIYQNKISSTQRVSNNKTNDLKTETYRFKYLATILRACFAQTSLIGLLPW